MNRAGVYAAAVALLAFLCGASCIREDRSDCPEPGYRVTFYYPGNGDTDIFPEKIDHLLLYVYDAAGDLVDSRSLSRQALALFQGVSLDLAPGDYTLVSWANAAEYSTVLHPQTLDRAGLYQSQWLAGETMENFDSLYYAAKTVTVESYGPQTERLDFVSAHIDLEVYLAGYGTVPSWSVGGQGILEIDPVPVGYDFRLNLQPEHSVLLPVWSSDTDSDVLSYRVHLLRFSSYTDMVLRVRGTDGGVRAEISLAEFLLENGIRVEGVNEVTVPVYILFRDNGYSVSIERWDTVPVDPLSGA
ncbi:MAG: FimB/Mfa2 family fimbrial subunit [Rikenellaceae bacterium]|nr:FimB/Mfa2 family fimbrial subunit [Rikenellaceae bacterium]